jgi:hypothetical protein
MDLHNPVTVILLAVLLAVSVGSIALALGFLAEGQKTHGRRVLRVWGVCAGLYVGVVLTIAIATRPPAMKLGAPYCDGDLCMTVMAIKKEPGFVWRYGLNVRLTSRANHELRDLNEVLVYLDNGRHGAHSTSEHPLAFDTPLAPGQSMETWLNFLLFPEAGKSYFEVRLDRVRYVSSGSGDAMGEPLMRLALD